MSPAQQVKSKTDALYALAGAFKNAAKSPNIYGYRPYPGPQERFHKSQAKNRQFIGGNRSGKTVGGGTETVMWLLGNHPYRRTFEPPVRLRCVTTDFKQGLEKIVKPEISKWMPPSGLINGSWEDSYNKELRTLTCSNGSFLEFLTYEQDIEKFAGTSRHGTWFDEEPPEHIFQECILRHVDTGGSWWMTMTPVEGMTWTFDKIYEPGMAGMIPTLEIIEADMADNPYLNEIQREEVLSYLDKDERKAREHGKYVQLGGRVYPQFSEETHVIPPFSPPVDWLWVAGMDHGFRNPTAWLWTCVDPDGRLFVFDEHYASGLLVNQHTEIVHQFNEAHNKLPDYYVGDPSIRNTDPITGTSILLEYLEYDIPIMLGNNDQKAGINRVAKKLTGRVRPVLEDGVMIPRQFPELFITENCPNLIREMKRLRWATWAKKQDEREKSKKEEQHKKDDHACDAVRYIVSSRPDEDFGIEIPEEATTPPVGTDYSRGISPEEEVTPALIKEFEEPSWRTYDESLGSDW